MASGSKPPFAFFVETCQEQQDYLQQIWRTNNSMEEQVDISELCKLTKERWQNLTQERRRAYVNVINVDGEKCGANDEKKKLSLTESSPASTSNVPTSKVGATPGGKKKKDQLAPKRTKSAYTFYLVEEGRRVREANPNWKLGEVTKELGRRWSGMKTPERKKYCDMAAKDRQRYDEEMRLFANQCREREREENMVEQKILNEEHNVALTNKQVEDKMDVQDTEAKESNLIECRERLRSVIEFGALKQKTRNSEMCSLAGSPEDRDVTKVEEDQVMDVKGNKKNDAQQEKTALKWKEKMVYDFKKEKIGYNFKENSLKDFISKETILADEAETKSCLDFVMKHYGVVISYEAIQNHKLKVGENNSEGIDLNMNDEMTHDFKRWKMAHDLREESLRMIAQRRHPPEIESFEDFVARHNKSVDSAKKIGDHEFKTEDPNMDTGCIENNEDPNMDTGCIENNETAQCVSNSDYSELKEENPSDVKFWKTEYNHKDNAIVIENSIADQLEMDSVVDLLAKDTKMVDSSKMILNAEHITEEDNMDMGGIQNNEAEGYISIQEKSEVKDKNVCDFKTETITVGEKSSENFNPKENTMADPMESESFLYFVSKHNNMVGSPNIIPTDDLGIGSNHNNMVGSSCKQLGIDISNHNNMVGSPHIIPSDELGIGSNHNNMVGSPNKIPSDELGIGSNHNNMVGSPCKQLGIDISNHNNMVGSPNIIPSDDLGIGSNHNNMVGSPNKIQNDELGIEKKNWTGNEDRKGADTASWKRSGEINTKIASSLPTNVNLDVLDIGHDAFGNNLIEETPTEDIKGKNVVNKYQDPNIEENDNENVKMRNEKFIEKDSVQSKVIQNREHAKWKTNMDTGAIENIETLGWNSIYEDLELNEKIEYDFKIENTSYGHEQTESKNLIAKEILKVDHLETGSILQLDAKYHEFVTNSELMMEKVEDGVIGGEPVEDGVIGGESVEDGVIGGEPVEDDVIGGEPVEDGVIGGEPVEDDEIGSEPKYKNGVNSELSCEDGTNGELNCEVEVSNNEIESNIGIMGINDVVPNATEKTGNGDMKEDNEGDI